MRIRRAALREMVLKPRNTSHNRDIISLPLFSFNVYIFSVILMNCVLDPLYTAFAIINGWPKDCRVSVLAT